MRLTAFGKPIVHNLGARNIIVVVERIPNRVLDLARGIALGLRKKAIPHLPDRVVVEPFCCSAGWADDVRSGPDANKRNLEAMLARFAVEWLRKIDAKLHLFTPSVAVGTSTVAEGDGVTSAIPRGKGCATP